MNIAISYEYPLFDSHESFQNESYFVHDRAAVEQRYSMNERRSRTLFCMNECSLKDTKIRSLKDSLDLYYHI